MGFYFFPRFNTGFKRKLALIAKVQDEIGHGQLLYSAAETLGKSREEMMNDLISGKSKYSNVFNYPAETWADVTVIGFLIDAAAIVNQLINSKGSYGPYGRALQRICSNPVQCIPIFLSLPPIFSPRFFLHCMGRYR